MYILILLTFLATSLIRNYAISILTIIQTTKLHNNMLNSLLRSKVSFFDSNPIGRILNRFSKDVSIADMILPVITAAFLDNMLRVLSIFFVIVIAVPWSLFIVAAIVALALLLRFKIMLVLKEAMKLNLMSRSPIAAVLGSTISGLSTIRAYNQQSSFQVKYEGLVDVNGKAYLTFNHLSRALGFYLESISIFFIIAWSFLSFAFRNNDNPLLLALTLQLVHGLLGIF